MPDNTPQEATEGTPEAIAEQPGTNTAPDNEGRENVTSDVIPEPQSFSREYVSELRDEIRTARIAAQQREDFLATEVRRYAIKETAAAAGLIDPEALSWSDEYTGEDGLPNHDRLRTAASELIKSRPWLARPRGDVGQGEHSAAEPGLSLSELLRA